jgi:hypothetical protein
MDEALKTLIAVLGKEVKTAAIPDDSKHTASWCIGQLAALYAKYGATQESRFADEINRLVQALLKELCNSKSKTGCSEAQLKVAAGIVERFRSLHEQFGLPGLQLKQEKVAPKPRSRKAG